MNPQLVPSDPSQADPSIVALMAGIKSNESGGNYNSLGDKNSQGQYTAAGVGNWSNQVNGIPQPLQKGQIPTNFQNDAKQYGLDPTDFSPANQNKVMYAILADGKINKKWTPEQELSAWNSGDPNKYLTETTDQTGSVGTYNVAKYVDDGMKAAQAYSQKNTQPGSNYNPTPFSNPNPGAVDTSGVTPPSASQNASQPITLGSIGKGALGLLTSAEKPFIGLAAAPIQGLAKALGQPDPYQQGIGGGQAPAQVDPLASTAGGVAEQETGNAAQVGSYLIPGGEGVGGAIAGGATMGLLQGAGNAMSNQGNLTDVATQGAEGAALGGGAAGALGTAGGLLAKSGESLTGEGTAKALQGLKDAYGSALNLNASERGFEARSGKDLAQVLMDNGVTLGRNDANNTLDASEAIPKLQEALEPLNEKAHAIVSAPGMNENSANFIPLSKVQNSVIDAIKASNIDSESKETSISNAMSLFKATQREYGDVVSPQVGERIKQGLQNTVFKKALTTSDALSGNVKYLASNEMRKAVEGAVSGTPEGDAYGAINAQRSDLVDAVKRLTKLDGTRVVKGGRLGKMAGGLTGTIIGGSTGNPLVALAGDYFGGKAAEFLNNPATKIAMARAKLGAAQVAPHAFGVAAKPVGKALAGVGGVLTKSARPAGLLSNLVLNSQNKGQ